jgi:hypothetical protein
MSALRAFDQARWRSDGFFVDVQTEVVHDFVRGCWVSYIDDESAPTRSRDFRIADRLAHTDNPR